MAVDIIEAANCGSFFTPGGSEVVIGATLQCEGRRFRSPRCWSTSLIDTLKLTPVSISEMKWTVASLVK